MGKVVSILIGLILIGLGVWGCILESWQQAVVGFIKGGVVIMALVIGLGILVFALSELRAVPEPPAPEPPAGESQQQ
jgi:hypothetical protein